MPDNALDYDGLGDWFDAHYRNRGDRLFRLETLPAYAVDDDGEDFRRWVAGATEPTWSRKQPVLDGLREEHEAGLIAERVRIFTDRLTDYERYACEFGYAYNSRFEDIRVLRHGEHPIPHDLRMVDFWLAQDGDGVHVALMHYDETGRFLGAEAVTAPAELAAYRATRDDLLAAAVPFTTWWARHPELHRRRAA